MAAILRRLAAPMLGLILGMAAFAVQAQHTPENLAGVTNVNAEQVKKLLDSGVMVVDTRVANEYAEEHIKGAKSVTYKEKSAKSTTFDSTQDSFDLAKLPSDKNVPVVFYCNAGECWKSYKASVVATRAGYKKVHWFRGGMPEWKSKKLPTE